MSCRKSSSRNGRQSWRTKKKKKKTLNVKSKHRTQTKRFRSSVGFLGYCSTPEYKENAKRENKNEKPYFGRKHFQEDTRHHQQMVILLS